MAETTKPLVAVIMGSKSDWEVMRAASDTYNDFGVPHENRVL
jgi:5-(carboxyamino)imidazole ribonucleotide mutase